jgi:hypothetical protein
LILKSEGINVKLKELKRIFLFDAFMI